MLEVITTWLVSPTGNSVAGWGGLLVSIVGFWITVRAARAAKRASESALSAITNIDVLQNLHEAVSILGHLKVLNQDETEPRVMSIYYSSLTKLLLEAGQSKNILSEEDLEIIKAVVLHAKLAQEEYGMYSRDRKYELDHAQLLKNLLDDESTLTGMHAAIRDKIGGDYVRHKSRPG